ncbi:HAD-IA family hydrolase [Patescibacteria group bacterium]|nr:HAD-IA family hydrolase [Patescibacteria group bacterium]MBU2036392.1 HAD-IA family hydrolase [Patescibacteria group bacterium]
MNTKPIIIFDFDGTISDSVVAMFEAINDLSPRLGFRKIKNEEYAEFRKMSTKGMVNELKIKKESIPEILKGIHRGLAERAESLKPVEGITKVLESLSERGYKMYIVTSNTKTNVENLLNRFKIDFFSGIYSESGLYGKSDLINKLIVDSGVQKEQIVYMGDETRDVEAGKKCGIKTMAVTWGLNGKEALQEKYPDWLIETPEELLKIFR